MDGQISTIKKLEMKKDDMLGMVMFNSGLSSTDLRFMEEEFDFRQRDIDSFVSCYKNLGIVFRLKPIQEKFLKEWKPFIQKTIRKSSQFDRFSNIFVNKSYDKILLVTNKRLLAVDLKKLNEKIEYINYRIESYDRKVLEEMNDPADAAKEEHKGIFQKVIDVLRG
ncbi:hypothetical protein KY366_07030 [Candidatus Woesearchaeota archaeon]|nr:hypothetical protein [Candidatus Woesearchaeota archaeon]